MATLSEQLKGVKVKPDGTLERDTSLQGAAADTGLLTTPASPGGAASIGASPDAAKMAGTPAALKSSTEIALAAPAAPAAGTQAQDQTAGLAKAERTQSITPKGQADPEQQARLEKQKQMQASFGDVGLKVNDLVEGAVQKAKAQATAAPATYALDMAGASKAAGVDVGAAGPALQALAADPTNQALMVAAQQALAAAGAPPSATTNPLSLLKAQTAQDVTAAAVANEVKLDPSTLASIGLTPDEMTQLGLTGDPASHTVAEVQAALAKLQTTADTGRAAREATTTGDAQTRRAASRDAAATQQGPEAAAERQTQEVLQKAQQGDTMEIGGQSYKLDDLLSDKGMTDLADRYLSSPEGSPMRAQVEQQMPTFAAFLKENGAALSKGQAAAGASAKGLQDVQAGNEQIKNTLKGKLQGVDLKELAALDPALKGLGEAYSKDATNLAEVPIVQMFTDPERYGVQGDPRDVLTKIKSFQALDPEATKTLLHLSPDEVKATGIFAAKDSEAAKAFQHFMDTAKERPALAKMDSKQMASYLFGADSMEDAWSAAVAKKEQGQGGDDFDRLSKHFDVDGDRQMDDPELITDRLRASATAGSLSDALKRGSVQTGKAQIGGAATPTGLAKLLGKAYKTGSLDPKAVEALPNDSSQVKPDELEKMAKGSSAYGPEVATKVASLRKDYGGKAVDKALFKPEGAPGREAWQYASAAIKGDDAVQPPDLPPKGEEGHKQATAYQQAHDELIKLAKDPNVDKTKVEGVASTLATKIALFNNQEALDGLSPSEKKSFMDKADEWFKKNKGLVSAYGSNPILGMTQLLARSLGKEEGGTAMTGRALSDKFEWTEKTFGKEHEKVNTKGNKAILKHAGKFLG